MASAGEARAQVAAGVHVGGAAQVLDPCRVKHQEAVPDGHIRKWIAFSGIDATRQGDVLFYFHGHIVQQVYIQRNYKGSTLRFRGFI